MLHSIILHPPSEKLMLELASELLKTPTAIGAAMLVADLYGEDLTPAIGSDGEARVIQPTTRRGRLASSVGRGNL